MKRKRKNKIMIYIDGENIPEKKYESIMKWAERRGCVVGCKVYGIQKDKSTRAWTIRANTDKRLKDIRLYGKSEKNKVDSKIIDDIRKGMRNDNNANMIVIASSDKDFSDIAIETRSAGEKVIGIGEAKASNKLRSLYDEFWEV